MNVWLIEDGEKRGPFPAFEIEGKIRAGELGSEVRGWIEGEREWRRLGELPAFAAVFHERVEREEQEWARWEEGTGPMPGVALPVPPPPLPPQALGHGHWWRRFFARWFDLQLFGLLWWACMRWAGRDLAAALQSPWMILAEMAPWFVLEIWLLHRFGTTPGKFLLGLRVEAGNGGPVALGEWVKRCARVWVLGLGLGLPLAVLLSQGVNWWIGWRTGSTMWDNAGRLRVRADFLNGVRVAVLVVGFVVILQLRGWILLPAILQIYGEQFPWLRELAK